MIPIRNQRLRRFARMSALALAAVICLAALVGAILAFGRPLTLPWYYNQTFFRNLVDSPITLTSLRLLDDTAFAWYSDQLDDLSIAQQDKTWQRLRQNAEQFKRFDGSTLTGSDQISWLVAKEQLDSDLAGEAWRWHSYPVNQLFGIQSQLPNFLIQQHLIGNERQARDYIRRLNAISPLMDDVIAGLTSREQRQMLPLAFSVNNTRDQIAAFIAPAVKEHALYRHMADAIKTITGLTSDQQNSYLAQTEQAISDGVYPAYRKLAAHLAKTAQLPLTNNGAWRLPNGDSYYQYCIYKHTSTHQSADAIHQFGLAEVARIGAEIDALLVKLNAKGQNRAHKIADIGSRPDQRYANDDNGRAAILRDYKAILDEAKATINDHFGLKPSQALDVKAVPAFAEKTAPGAYYDSPSLDGTRPGVFFVNLYKVDAINRYGMRTLAYHEGIPGHHMQIALQLTMADLPYFRRVPNHTAYIEGWALYAERLASEIGLEPQAIDNLGRLQAEMFRAVRLVVDTGLHAKHWSREQAIAYMERETGMGNNEVTVEIERYLIEPGQALAYKIGMETILSLRGMAQKRLGDRFRLSDFHTEVLKNGSMPLSVLEKVINDWVERTSSARPS